MSAAEINPTVAASWQQLEVAVERLHAAARAGLTSQDFYASVLEETGAVLGAARLIAWRHDGVAWRRLAEIGQGEVAEDALLERAAATGQPVWSDEDGAVGSRPLAELILICPVLNVPVADSRPAAALLEIHGAEPLDPSLRQTWRQIVTTISDVAADHHILDALKRLSTKASLIDETVGLLRRLHRARRFPELAMTIANEGRRLAACDRLSVLVRRGRAWRLAAASGVEHVQRSADFTRDSEQLAARVAPWGEPLEYGRTLPDDLPGPLADAMERHVDRTQAQQLCVVPISFPNRNAARREAVDMVLLAERFSTQCSSPLQESLVEFGELCAPAAAQAQQFQRLPGRLLLRWSEREPLAARSGKWVLALAALCSLLATMLLVRRELEVEAPAVLEPVVQRDVFATATGAVAEVRVKHGDDVAAGDVLAVLIDPQLALERQAVQGEIATAGERLAAIAAARTERRSRTESVDTALPLSAEGQQIRERLASLKRQAELLDDRQEALTLRSPIAGRVLTLDVQSLLAARPVERGQHLFTVADVQSGWQLRAEVAQDDLGKLLRDSDENSLRGVRYRLVGEPGRDYQGRLVEVAAAAVLDADHLTAEAPAVPVVVEAVDEVSVAARPGMSATVRIGCGEYSLGYILFHDAAATITRWVTF